MMLIAKGAKVGQARHASVGRHDLANDGGVLETGEAGEVGAAFGVAGAD
jgi:hypothetical protein